MFCIINVMIMIQWSLVGFNSQNRMNYWDICSRIRAETSSSDLLAMLQTLWKRLKARFFLFCVALDCLLYAVGKPVYFKSSDQNYGSWLRDPLARNDVSAERIWMTKENDGFQLYEFSSKGAFRNNNPSKIYNMQFPFQVN